MVDKLWGLTVCFSRCHFRKQNPLGGNKGTTGGRVGILLHGKGLKRGKKGGKNMPRVTA